jgi:hypothetical protein
MMVAYQAMFMANSSMRFVWGGGMAIRSGTFEQLDVAQEWSRTVVDDITLSGLLRRAKMKAVYDPRCLVVSSNAASSIREVVEWCMRQILYVKFYSRSLWLSQFLVHIPSSLMMMAALPLMLTGTFLDSVMPAALVCLGFSLVAMIAQTLAKLTCRDGQSALRWFALSPLLAWVSTYCLLRTAFSRTVRWNGVTYKLDCRGRVVGVERSEPEEDQSHAQ